MTKVDKLYESILSALYSYESIVSHSEQLYILLNAPAYKMVVDSAINVIGWGDPYLFGRPVRVTYLEQDRKDDIPRFWICREGTVYE